MNKLYIIAGLLVTLTFACTNSDGASENKTNEEEVDKAPTLVQQIITETRKKYGSDAIDKKSIRFKFREYTYKYIPSIDGIIRSRTKKDSVGTITHDEWKNEDLSRLIGDTRVDLDDKTKKLYINAINSVFYFAFLPKSLSDPAVNTKLLDTVEISETPYFKIQVTFNEEGGGEDHEDIFLYWIHTKNYTMDFLAYKYFTEGGGMRFREAINPRTVNGIIFQDYINYKPSNKEQNFLELDYAFNKGDLTEVSRIELEDVEVSDISE